MHFTRRREKTRGHHGLAQVIQINRPPDFHRAKIFQVIGNPLDVEQPESPGAQNADQREQRDLRSLADTREHRFAEKDPSQLHAVKSSGQASAGPHLHAVRRTLRMQLRVNAGDGRIDPRLGTIRATGHHIVESGIDRHRERQTRQRAPEAVRQMESVQRQDSARIG